MWRFKAEDVEHTVARHLMHYNFARSRRTLGAGVWPVMTAGAVNNLLTVNEIVG